MSRKPTYEELALRVKALEDQLAAKRQADEIYRLNQKIVAVASIGIAVYQQSGQCILANQAAADFVGATIEQVLGQNFHQIQSWKEKGLYDLALASMSDLDIKHTELSITTSFGKKVALHCRLVPFTFKNERYLSVMFEDITDRKVTQHQLQETLLRFNAMIQASPIAIIFLDTKGDVTLINQAAEKLFGWRAEEIVGQPNPLIPQNQKAEFKHHFQRVMAGETIEAMEIRRTRRDGSVLELSSYVVPLHDAEQQIIGVVGMLVDITERNRSELEKERLRAQLAQSRKMESIGTLAGGIAHDFNNILTSIIGFTELALEDVQKESMIADNLREVYAAGKRAKEIVRQILTYARQSNAETYPLQLKQVITDSLGFIRSTIPTTIEIIPYLESDSLIVGNSAQLHQIMLNLCSNAADAMEDRGGVLELRLADVRIDQTEQWECLDLPSGDYICLTISDTGTGISPKIVDTIFDPYFTTKEPGRGTGMGLSVVKGIVESHGGQITVVSRPQEPTAFAVYLPVTTYRPTHMADQPNALPLGTEQILFVDDEAAIATMGQRILERLGYRVETMTDSFEALQRFRAAPDGFDLVVTDMTMPKMTGDQLATELIKIRADIPVILCTGYSQKINETRALSLGIKAFAHKPMVTADLAQTVRRVLDEIQASEDRT